MTYTWTVDLESTLSKRVDFFTGIIRNYPLFETNFKIKFFTLILKQKGVRVAKPAERIPPPHMSDYASHAVAVGCVCSPISPEKSCKTTKSAEPGLACNCVRSSEYRFGFKCLGGWTVLCSDPNSPHILRLFPYYTISCETITFYVVKYV